MRNISGQHKQQRGGGVGGGAWCEHRRVHALSRFLSISVADQRAVIVHYPYSDRRHGETLLIGYLTTYYMYTHTCIHITVPTMQLIAHFY